MELNNDADRLTPRKILGDRLRLMREDAGLTLRDLKDEVGFPDSYLSRMETGKQLPSEKMAEALDRYFNTKGLFSQLLKLAHDSVVPGYGLDFLAKEPSAERIQVFASSVIPGLLQSEEYAYELLRRSLPGKSEETLRDLVSLRIDRQGIFNREKPPFYWAIIDEAALKRKIGGAKRMAEQLHHLLQALRHPHVTMQVLPFSEGAHPMLGGSLTLLTLLKGETIAYVESFDSGELVESTKKVIEHTQRFDVARSLALPEEKSTDLIRQYLEEYENEDNS